MPLAAVLGACVSGLVIDRQCETVPTRSWLIVSLLAVVLSLVFGRMRACRALAAPALLLAFGGAGAAWHHARWFDTAPDDLSLLDWSEPSPAWLRGVLVEVPEYRPARTDSPNADGSTRLILAATSRCDGRDWHAASGRVLVHVEGRRTDLEMGQPVEVSGVLQTIPGPRNPGEADYRDYWRAEAVRLQLSVESPSAVQADASGRVWPCVHWLGQLRQSSYRRLVADLPEDVAPLAAALLLGRRAGVDPQINSAFMRTGTIHLLAISGLHMQALATVCGALVATLGLGRKRSAFVVLVSTIGYSVLVGARPSVLRSATMTVSIVLGILLGRQSSPANVLALAALATLAINPAFLFDTGCQLSFLCVATLIWAVPPVARLLGIAVPVVGLAPGSRTQPGNADAHTVKALLDRLERQLESPRMRLQRKARQGVLLSLLASSVVWILTAPLLVLRFNLLSWVGILANLALLPMSLPTLAAAGVSLASAFVWAPLATWPSAVCAALLRETLTFVRGCANWNAAASALPGPPVAWVLGFYVIAAFLAWSIHQGRTVRARCMGICALALWSGWGILLVWLPSVPRSLEIEVLAVDHGLSVLLRAPSGRTLLYDCGQMRSPRVGRRIVAPAVWERGARRIDVLVLSHADADHYNGVDDLLDRMPIGELRVPPAFGVGGNPDAARLLDRCRRRGLRVRQLTAGQELELGPGVHVRVLHPLRDFPLDLPDNDSSVVLDVSAHDRHCLLTGDLEGAGLRALLDQPRAAVDILLSPHHGARAANTPALCEWASPKLIIASQKPPLAGSIDALTRLPVREESVLRTWREGAIRLIWGEVGIQVSSFLHPTKTRGRFAHLSSMLPVFAQFDIHAAPGWTLAAFALLACIAGLLACFWLAIVGWGGWALVAPGRGLANPPVQGEAGAQEWTNMSIRARDGAMLHGFLRSGSEKVGGLVVLLHGFAEDGRAMFARGDAMVRRGWSVLLVDNRARGESGGAYCTFGASEASDLSDWLDELAKRIGSGVRVGLWGRSMGAAIALRAATLDTRISALVLEAPYASLASSVAAGLRRKHLPGWLAPVLIRRASRFAGVPLDKPTPIELATRVRVPALVLLGLDDRVAAPSEVRAVAAALPTATQLMEVPQAGHNDVFDVGGSPLADRIHQFLDQSIENSSAASLNTGASGAGESSEQRNSGP